MNYNALKRILLFVLVFIQLAAFAQLDLDFSHKRGFYNNSFQLTLTINDPSATIRYTTNGDKPSVNSGTIYSGPVSISTTAFVRAIAYKIGVDTTKVKTHTYIFLNDVLTQTRPSGYPTKWGNSGKNDNADFDMDPDVVNHSAYKSEIKNDLLAIPTISIVMNKNDMFDPNNGIYNKGGSGNNSAYEKECSIELIYPNNEEEGFQINCGIRPHSHQTLKRSFKLMFKKEYGPGKLAYPLFESAPMNADNAAKEFDKIVLRAGTNRSYTGYMPEDQRKSCYARDEWVRQAQISMSGYGVHGMFAHLYINGLYWGLYNPCERPDESFTSAYFGGEKEDWFAANHGGDITGSPSTADDRWDYFVNTIGNAGDLNNSSKYNEVRQYLDMEAFIDYITLYWYSGAGDWQEDGYANNFYVGNRNDPAGPVRFIAWDAESSLHDSGPPPQNRPSRSNDGAWIKPQFLTTEEGSNYPFKSTTHRHIARPFRNLFKNQDFRQLWYDRLYKHLYNDGTLTDKNAIDLWMTLCNYVEGPVVGESAKWGDGVGDYSYPANPNNYPFGSETVKIFTRDQYFYKARDYVAGLLTGNAAKLVSLCRNQDVNGYPLYPSINPPLYQNNSTNIEVQKMEVSAGYKVKLKNPNNSGTIYYTTDGSDPRLSGGAISPNAKTYNGETVSIDNPLLLLGRVKDGSEWSALHCLAFFVKQNLSALKVTEIMYHPPVWQDVTETELEFIELKNTSTTETLNLSGLRFVDGIDFEFPMGTTLAPQEFIVLASSKEMLLKKCPGLDIFGEYTGQLRNSGEWVKAATFGGDTVFAFQYDDQAPWSQLADGLGYSLVSALPNPVGDQNSADQWTVSADNTCGSPGEDDPNSAEKGLRAFFTVSERTVCAGEDVTFTNASSGAEGSVSYQWNFGNAASPATATGEGPHTITYSASGNKTITLNVSDDNGTNEASSEVTVNPPVVAEITGNNSICGAPEQDFIAFGDEWKYFKGNSEASSPTDAWTKLSFDDNSWESGPSPFWYDNGSGGTLLSDMKDNYTTLFFRKKINVSGASAINVLDVTADYDDGFVVWINGNKVLTVNGPANPVYDTLALQDHESGTSEQFTIANASEYLQEGDNVIAAMGFNKSAGSSDFHFNLALSYDGQKTTLTASGGTQYQWSTGENASSITVSPAQTTTYTVTVSQGGCSDIVSKTVAVGSLLPEITQNNNILAVNNVPNAVNYQWFLNGQPIQGAGSATYTATQNGVYSVEVTDNTDCSGTSHDYHFVLNGLVENAQNFLKIFPNPNDGVFTVEFPKSNIVNANIEIYNSLGEKVSFKERSVNTRIDKIDISRWPSGIYLLNYQAEGKLYKAKIFKE